ncbi:hypothetical protein [Methylovorus mays]|uniref:hypothetical protein n=1 Tax=Methylovorus mays TaxID=184077 RepID=UPI001E401922|nr:hypothetical protein [Methylovorus mays]MCB5208064.1 hypothetical protein [Methylovorus mays]
MEEVLNFLIKVNWMRSYEEKAGCDNDELIKSSCLFMLEEKVLQQELNLAGD